MNGKREDLGVCPGELNKVAKLVGIKIADSEVVNYCRHLSNVAQWFETLSEVDTNNLELVTYGGNSGVAVMRQDVVSEGDIRTELLDNAPSKEMGFYVVRKVIE